MVWIKREESVGVIVSKDARKVWVAPPSTCETDKKSGCGGGCASCSGASKARKVAVFTNDAAQYPLGAQVRFSHFIPEPGIVALVVFGLPLLFSIAAMLGWYSMAPQRVESPAAIISAGAAFAAGFAVVGFLDLLFRRKYPSKLLDTSADISGSDRRA